MADAAAGRPDDYVIATGRIFTVREMCRIAFDCAGLDMERHLVIDPVLFRPAEVDALQGDASKARTPARLEAEVTLEATIHEMVEADLRACRAKRRLRFVAGSGPSRRRVT